MRLKLLYRCINYYGFSFGTVLFFKISSQRLSNIKLPNYRHPFSLRKDTTDLQMFYQVYFSQCYDLKLPFTPQLIVDAGANIGLASIFFAEKYPDCRIVSIEPESKNFEHLVKNCQPYQVIIPHRAALFNSISTLVVNDIGLGESGFVVSDEGGGEEVQAITIEKIKNDHDVNLIDILKIDIEGSEKNLFMSDYEAWLPKVRCLIIELHDDIKPGSSQVFFRAISQFNFRLTLGGENLIFINNDL